MRDALSLEQLAERVEQQQRHRKVFSWVYIVLLTGYIIFLFFEGLLILTLPRSISAFLAGNHFLLYVLALVILFAYQVAHAYHQTDQARRHLRELLPEVEPRPGTLYFWLGAWGAVFVVMLGAALLLQPLFSRVGQFEIVVTMFAAAAFRYWIAIIPWSLNRLRTRMIKRLYEGALRRADYDGALRELERSSWLNAIDPMHRNGRGYVLMLANRPAEAEQYLRDALPLVQHDRAVLAIFVYNLGVILSEQRRFAEALPLLEAAIAFLPEFGVFYVGTALWYLDQDIQLARAHELAEYGLERLPPAVAEPMKIQEAQLYSVVAHVVARNGRMKRAQTLLDHAVDNIDVDYLPGYAAVRLNVGRVAALRGETERAADRFREVIEIDPNGSSGHEARQCLGQLIAVEAP